MEWNFETAAPVSAKVGLPAGRVDLRPRPVGGISVTLEPIDGGRRTEEAIAAAKVTFEVPVVRVEIPNHLARRTQILCVLEMPEGSSATIRTASADIACDGTLASADIATASGDVSLGDVTGDLTVASASGDLVCRNVGGELQVKGASSDVSAGRVEGPVRIALASGDVVIGDAAGHARIRTASGDVRLDMVHEGEITADSASGDVVIGVANGVGAHLDVTTVSGESRCTLPFEDGTGTALLSIRCRTLSGDVVIRSAAAVA